MPGATCRCGQALTLPADGSDRIVCPKCGARVRVRRKEAESPADNSIRFACSCGRRLKVPADRPPTHGQCPDCGKVVPVPAGSLAATPPNHPETPTEELAAADLATLERWSQGHRDRAAKATAPISAPASPGGSTVLHTTPPAGKSEAGLRVCPKCCKPVHLGASVCRACGTPMPKPPVPKS